MSSQYDNRLALMTGIDFPIPDCHLVIHQPTLKEIALVGEDEYFTGLQTLCLYKSMFENGSGKSIVSAYSNFQIFMTIMKEKETADKKAAVQQILLLLFPNYQVSFIGRNSMTFFDQSGEGIMIDDNNFETLQKTVRQVACLNEGPTETQNFNPADERARKIAEKLMKNRQKLAEQKKNSISSILTQYISSLSVGLRMSPDSISSLTMFQLYDLVERYSLYQAWDIDMKARLAGAEGDSKVENWMKNIHE